VSTVWVTTIPCIKELEALRKYYDDYDSLKQELFEKIKKTGVFNEIGTNKKILLKPNWVYHNRTRDDEICLTTHPNIILIALEFVLQLKPASVIIGDSPVQSCSWELLHSEKFNTKIASLEKEHGIPIRIIDFRNEKWELKRNLQKNCRNKSDYVLYNLASDSLLEPLSKQNKSFRVGDYDPAETIRNHSNGIHKYLIAKEIIDADIVVNLPKLKTHQKAGITNGLKNYVGTIGEKAYLAHHSSNLSKSGGDCYPGNNIFRNASEYFGDISYKYKGNILYYLFHYTSSLLWRFAPKSNYASMSGSWYGNDTVWRMVIDINKIISFGTIEGRISNSIQRKIITISDAIVAGQGDGPLKPIPLAMGMVSVSDNDMFLDFIMSHLMGFDPLKIPLLKSFTTKYSESEYNIYMNGNRISKSDLMKYAVKTIPPIGWVDKIEFEQC